MEKQIASHFNAVKVDKEHSMENVASINGVTFINDSKSINAKQTAENINSLEADIVLILGGDDSKTDYSWFSAINNHHIHTIIYFGRRVAEIKHIFNKHTMILLVDNMESAINLSKTKTVNGQVVLFSPACPSYDPFDNYKNRGNKFKELVSKS